MMESKKKKTERCIKTLQILNKTHSHTMLAKMGRKSNPFKVLISTILSARSKDETTEVIANNLFKFYPDAKKLAFAKPKVIEKMIKSIGFYRNKTKNIIAASQMLLDDFNGKVPQALDDLMKLPGVGRKVGNCVLVYAYDTPAIPVDIHVHRISNRLGLVETKDPEKTEHELVSFLPRKYWTKINDLYVWHGKTICQPIIPKCSECTIYKYCKRVGVTKSK